jgi:hypothetical protein
MLLVYIIESSESQCQDGINHPQKYSNFPFLGDTQMLIHILQGVKANAKRGLKHLLLSH